MLAVGDEYVLTHVETKKGMTLVLHQRKSQSAVQLSVNQLSGYRSKSIYNCLEDVVMIDSVHLLLPASRIRIDASVNNIDV